MLLFGNGTHFIHEDGGTDLRSAADAFSLLTDSTAAASATAAAAAAAAAVAAVTE
ncbi:hypothetical protein ETH_00038435 [Eimeria tenella]|uniref:Uncharacterized protein n=1 Tax=Eimeria tenella TaxID=5802 RepID=U6KQT7_EIMTE|nr:hypothetical protein ETH_00038435 [Eimeria tenella]CDJ40336.1 hypothetical protein ETH_00038435 [Eimeria tenella]|eukprot:XP_013231086.1 hypothetical protein ETH_00038435 [Eimeria tenella]